MQMLTSTVAVYLETLHLGPNTALRKRKCRVLNESSALPNVVVSDPARGDAWLRDPPAPVPHPAPARRDAPAPAPHMPATGSAEDQDLVDGLPGKTMLAFRSFAYSSAFIAQNPAFFLDDAWIDVPALRKWLQSDANTQAPSSAPLVRVKTEREATPPSRGMPEQAPRLRIHTDTETGREQIEILSSDEESRGSSFCGLAHKFPGRRLSESAAASSSPYPASHYGPHRPSETKWLDAGVTSTVRTVHRNLTGSGQTFVEEIEYVKGIPSGFPVPRRAKAYVVDGTGIDERDEDGHLIPMDILFRNADNDSWHSHGGKGTPVKVTFGPGETYECYRKRHNCNGCAACEYVDPSLMGSSQYEKRSRKKAQDLNLDWPCFTPNGLNRTTALEAALGDAENFKLEYPKYAALVDEALAAKASMAKK
ncbi:hypothetical protein GGX14DRAFT_396796 [Mycena pura]|uniref:Uncharacterized protein n=1 Tax=Mycena pura TaxID=153505 RepID=A0AAD6V9Z1_9AGAR|nr:hypothetical protein GGX14DRAFT_396796 [Mycena pura]